MSRGSNLPAVGTYNQTLTLDLIRRAPEGMSRVELTERTGLSAQTLSNVTRRLTDEGFIVEAGKVRSGPGKPRTLLALNPQARYAVGVHLDPSVTTVVLVDFAGDVVRHAELAPHGADVAETGVIRIAESVEELIEESGIPRDRVLGIGVAMPGPLDAATGRVLDPPLLPGWHGVPVRAELEAATDLPVLLEKDVTASMIGEMWVSAAEELSNAMFLYYGTGVGAGFSLMGVPVRGTTSNAGNIAHLRMDPAGPLCECGSHGCLGVSIEPARLIADAQGLERGPGTLDDARADLQRLCASALSGDLLARQVLDRTAAHLARALVEIDNLLDVDIAVFGGPVWKQLGPYLLPAVEREVTGNPATTTTRPIALRESRLDVDVAAVGAACLLLDGSFTARPSSLLIHE